MDLCVRSTGTWSGTWYRAAACGNVYCEHSNSMRGKRSLLQALWNLIILGVSTAGHIVASVRLRESASMRPQPQNLANLPAYPTMRYLLFIIMFVKRQHAVIPTRLRTAYVADSNLCCYLEHAHLKAYPNNNCSLKRVAQHIIDKCSPVPTTVKAHQELLAVNPSRPIPFQATSFIYRN